MTRAIAEQSNRLSVFFLKEHGYLPQGVSRSYGGIRWTSGNWQNNMRFVVCTSSTEDANGEKGYIELIYTVTVRWSGEKTDMRYRVPLITTPCHFGGKRYWFKCPLYKNGVYCGRRVGILYSVDKWFGCRYCAEVAYQAQFEGGKFRVGSVSEPDVQKAYGDVKREYYNGKPTRKYKRFLRLSQKMDESWLKMAKRLGLYS